MISKTSINDREVQSVNKRQNSRELYLFDVVGDFLGTSADKRLESLQRIFDQLFVFALTVVNDEWYDVWKVLSNFVSSLATRIK